MKQSIKLTESELKTLIAECINEAISTPSFGERGIDHESYLNDVQNRIRKIYDWTSELVQKLNDLENYESDVSKAPNPIIIKLYDFLGFLRSKEFDAYLNNLTNRGAMSKGIMDYNPLTKRKTIDKYSRNNDDDDYQGGDGRYDTYADDTMYESITRALKKLR